MIALFQKIFKRDRESFTFNTKKMGSYALCGGSIILVSTLLVGITTDFNTTTYEKVVADIIPEKVKEKPSWPLPLNSEDYNSRMLSLAHYEPQVQEVGTTTTTSKPISSASTSVSVPGSLWPTAAAYPYGGAILPFSRIVAYYGNFYSTRMGVLGEYSHDEVLQKLKEEVAKWTAADPTTPAIPAIQYIAIVAQDSAGPRGLYRAQMPDEEIDKALDMANEIGGLLFLDIQIGKSTLQAELPEFEKYLKLPNVHFALDPEFSMKYGDEPGDVIGTYDAKDINYAAEFLAKIVRDNKLPPKVLVIHRFTQAMVTNYEDIKPLPEVQIVMDMDGWGDPAKKKGTYNHIVAPEPIQFTGVKLFYGNDLKAPSTRLLTTDEILNLTPSPVYIQYQ